jgi:7,8-dihydro-6-hydroxymethylpterin-pyrophosphokinase
VCHAEKVIEANNESMVNLLEYIERFLRRIEIYTQVPHTLDLDKIVVNILLQLLSILALATGWLKQGKSGQSFVIDVLPY